MRFGLGKVCLLEFGFELVGIGRLNNPEMSGTSDSAARTLRWVAQEELVDLFIQRVLLNRFQRPMFDRVLQRGQLRHTRLGPAVGIAGDQIVPQLLGIGLRLDRSTIHHNCQRQVVIVRRGWGFGRPVRFGHRAHRSPAGLVGIEKVPGVGFLDRIHLLPEVVVEIDLVPWLVEQVWNQLDALELRAFEIVIGQVARQVGAGHPIAANFQRPADLGRIAAHRGHPSRGLRGQLNQGL